MSVLSLPFCPRCHEALQALGDPLDHPSAIGSDDRSVPDSLQCDGCPSGNATPSETQPKSSPFLRPTNGERQRNAFFSNCPFARSLHPGWPPGWDRTRTHSHPAMRGSRIAITHKVDPMAKRQLRPPDVCGTRSFRPKLHRTTLRPLGILFRGSFIPLDETNDPASTRRTIWGEKAPSSGTPTFFLNETRVRVVNTSSPRLTQKPLQLSPQVHLACAADPKDPLKIPSIQNTQLDRIRTDDFPKEGTR